MTDTKMTFQFTHSLSLCLQIFSGFHFITPLSTPGFFSYGISFINMKAHTHTIYCNTVCVYLWLALCIRAMTGHNCRTPETKWAKFHTMNNVNSLHSHGRVFSLCVASPIIWFVYSIRLCDQDHTAAVSWLQLCSHPKRNSTKYNKSLRPNWCLLLINECHENNYFSIFFPHFDNFLIARASE